MDQPSTIFLGIFCDFFVIFCSYLAERYGRCFLYRWFKKGGDDNAGSHFRTCTEGEVGGGSGGVSAGELNLRPSGICASASKLERDDDYQVTSDETQALRPEAASSTQAPIYSSTDDDALMTPCTSNPSSNERLSLSIIKQHSDSAKRKAAQLLVIQQEH